MAGQCVGAGGAERAVKTAKTAVAHAVGVLAVMVAQVFLFAGSIVSLFDGDSAVVAEGRYLASAAASACLVLRGHGHLRLLRHRGGGAA